MLGLALLLAVQSASSPPLHGGPEMMTCPIGGERFEALVSHHYSTYGARPDGRPNSYWYMPLPIPECPSNGLVLFKEFTPDEIAVLTTLVASEEYRAMVGRDSTYYRAQWLATRIGRPEQEALDCLLAATWQVKPVAGPTGQSLPSPELARRYQEEFVARVLALPEQPEDEAYLVLHARAANALREIGRFDEAAATLRRMRLWIAGRNDREDLQRFTEALAAVIDRRDDSVQPLDMAEGVDVPWLCMDEARPQSEFDRAICGSPEVQARIAENRRRLEERQRQGAQP